MENYFKELIIDILETDFSQYIWDHLHHNEIISQIFYQNYTEEGFSKQIIINNIKSYIEKNNLIPNDLD